MLPSHALPCMCTNVASLFILHQLPSWALSCYLLKHIEKIGILAFKKNCSMNNMIWNVNFLAQNVPQLLVSQGLQQSTHLWLKCHNMHHFYGKISRNKLLQYHYKTHLLLCYVCTHIQTHARTHKERGTQVQKHDGHGERSQEDKEKDARP